MVERDIALLEEMLKRLDEKYAICAEGIKARIAELQRVKEGADLRRQIGGSSEVSCEQNSY